MSKLLWQMFKTAPIALGSAFLLANGASAAQNAETESAARSRALVPAVESTAEVPSPAPLNFEAPAAVEVANEMTPTNNSSTLQQIESYSSEGLDSSLGQSAQGASKFRDVRPTDWAFQALDDLVKRYDCLVGYPDGTFRGNRALTRYEFAAGLNACLNQIERLIASSTAGFATKEDLETLRRLMAEFEAELATLGTRVDNLEARTAFLEDHQFSTTTKLRGEVIFALADVFTDTDKQFDTNLNRRIDARDTTLQGGNTIFGDRVRLNFDTSFTGKDLLRVRLQARNISNIIPTVAGTATRLTNEGRLGFEGDEGNNVALDDVYYRFPILNDRGRVQVWANGTELNDMFDPVNPLESSGSGALSRFGRFNPIYRAGGQNAAIAADFNLSDWINIAAAYTAGEANNAGPGEGVFNGDYAIAGQVTFKPFDGRMKIAGLYVHGYQGTIRNDQGILGSRGVDMGTGTRAASFRLGTATPVVSNSYGVNVNFNVTDSIFVGGWGGYTHARAIGRGDGDIWNWAGYAGLNDLGAKGSRLGFIFGREPYLAGADASVGTVGISGLARGDRADADNSYHFEGFYRFPVNKNISLTPGIIAITNPGGQSANDTLWIGVLRTTFSF